MSRFKKYVWGSDDAPPVPEGLMQHLPSACAVALGIADGSVHGEAVDRYQLRCIDVARRDFASVAECVAALGGQVPNVWPSPARSQLNDVVLEVWKYKKNVAVLFGVKPKDLKDLRAVVLGTSNGQLMTSEGHDIVHHKNKDEFKKKCEQLFRDKDLAQGVYMFHQPQPQAHPAAAGGPLRNEKSTPATCKTAEDAKVLGNSHTAMSADQFKANGNELRTVEGRKVKVSDAQKAQLVLGVLGEMHWFSVKTKATDHTHNNALFPPSDVLILHVLCCHCVEVIIVELLVVVLWPALRRLTSHGWTNFHTSSPEQLKLKPRTLGKMSLNVEPTPKPASASAPDGVVPPRLEAVPLYATTTSLVKAQVNYKKFDKLPVKPSPLSLSREKTTAPGAA